MKVYLETSFISACVTNRTDPSSLHRKKESLDWWASERHKHELVISEEVLLELSVPTCPVHAQAVAFVARVQVLEVTTEARAVGQILLDEHLMPNPLGGDAIHVAVATLAKPNTFSAGM